MRKEETKPKTQPPIYPRVKVAQNTIKYMYLPCYIITSGLNIEKLVFKHDYKEA